MPEQKIAALAGARMFMRNKFAPYCINRTKPNKDESDPKVKNETTELLNSAVTKQLSVMAPKNSTASFSKSLN